MLDVSNPQTDNLNAVRSKLRALLAEHDKTQDLDYLLCSVLGRSRSWLYAHPEYTLHIAEQEKLEQQLQAYLDGAPLAQLRAWCEFYSLRLAVSPATLIPRPATELLVTQALHLCGEEASVLDLGTGCGNIACALQVQRPRWNIVASDICAQALAVARSNARYHGLHDITFCLSDWFDEVDGDFDLIVSNPPYIAEDDDELEQAVRAYEPGQALFAGQDGLAALQHIIQHASAHLRAQGYLLLEHGHRQSDAVYQLFEEAGFCTIERLRDDAGKWRAVVGRLAA